ncbi:MAG: D-aminopeptidase [Actinomycetota bacterium]|jgi:D-aminopeptidase|nr:D-aminopeptidase [Actinomycetota bacterium]MEA2581851.1 D-aminopeptidase [Actinomycetota bacterium]
MTSRHPRYRDLGLTVGLLPPGPLNAITDVAGVAVGVTTLIEGDGPLVVGEGPIRTGVTVVHPHPDITHSPVFAGCHRLNGNGELTGLEWVRESGQLTTPIAITNTHSVGVARDALVAADVAAQGRSSSAFWSLPVAGETYDGSLNDINGFHIRPEHVTAALAGAIGGSVPEGNVGGGTGMICHEFKGGTGTASRVNAGWTVGALVQANHGQRARLTVDGVPVGREIGPDVVPSPWDQEEMVTNAGSGSVIVILATDAPLLPHQCERLAQRAALGIARAGGGGEHSSGDLILAFANGNAGRFENYKVESATEPFDVQMVPEGSMTELFWSAIEATEEAILNALIAAETMTGRDGITAYALDHEALIDVMSRYGRGPGSR